MGDMGEMGKLGCRRHLQMPIQSHDSLFTSHRYPLPLHSYNVNTPCLNA